MQRVYRHFDLPFTPELRARLHAHVKANPKGGYGRNTYRLTDFGMDAGVLREAFADYTSCFDVEREAR